MSEIIIHGASSFIGKHFSKKLIASKTPFTIIARKQTDLSFTGNAAFIKVIRYQNTLDEIEVAPVQDNQSTFFEFSWNGVFGSERNNPEQLTVNIPLVISSIKLAHRFKSRHWIGFGSQAEYGNSDKKISESDNCLPTTLYGKSKYLCSQISRELCQAYEINHSWLRLFSVYGPDDNHEWLIQYLIKKMLKNEPLDVTKGEQTWDYLYVSDITDMLLQLMKTNGCGIANLASGASVAIKDIITAIKELTHSNSTINFGAVPYRPDQVMRMEADITKLQAATGWYPTTTLTQGLTQTILSLKEAQMQ